MRLPPSSDPCCRVELTVPSVTGALPIVRAAITKLLESLNVNPDDATAVGLAVDEALANVIEHAYDRATDQKIDICGVLSGQTTPATLTVTIRHYGQQVDPRVIQGRELDDIRPGGLGVHIIQSVMDRVEYHNEDSGGMTMTLVKAFAPTQRKSGQE